MEENQYIIKSLMKAFELLELVVKNDKMSIKEINDVTKLGKSTVFRILSTLKEMNYIDQNEEDSKYFATVKIFELGNSVTSRMPIKKIAKPFLRQLHEECNETVNLAILNGDDIIFLEKILTKEPLRIDLDVGRRVPIYCSSLGKSMLAFSNRRDYTDMEFQKFTEKTICSSEDFVKVLDKVRENGYAFDDEEYVEHLSCISTPIKNKDNMAIAAISIATPTFRLDDNRKDEFINLLKSYASKIELEMQRNYWV